MRLKFLASMLGLLLASCSYLPDEGSMDENVRQEQGDFVLYYSGDQIPENAFLMVPGGLVDPYVYACWIDRLVKRDSTLAVVLVKYPSNLSIMNIGKVMKVKDQFTDFKRWVIGGHSLGGTVAATVLRDYPDDFEGLVMMGSWSREATDLSDWQGVVLSMYGSEDQVATEDEIMANVAFLPEAEEIDSPADFSVSAGRTYYFKIEGGNHSGFGCYGPQDGDGEALVSSEEQQDQMITAMNTFFSALW